MGLNVEVLPALPGTLRTQERCARTQTGQYGIAPGGFAMKKTSIGFAMTGSFCTFERVLKQMEALVRRGYEVVPVLSFNAGMLDTRFMTAEHLRARIVEITGQRAH